jgi:hypothetical protein
VPAAAEWRGVAQHVDLSVDVVEARGTGKQQGRYPERVERGHDAVAIAGDDDEVGRAGSWARDPNRPTDGTSAGGWKPKPSSRTVSATKRRRLARLTGPPAAQ